MILDDDINPYVFVLRIELNHFEIDFAVLNNGLINRRIRLLNLDVLCPELEAGGLN